MTTDTKSKNRSSRKATGLTTARPAKDKLVEEFLGFLEVERNASPRTLRIYRDALRDFRAQTNAPAWRQCTAQHFRDYLFDLMKRKQARSYIRLQFSALRSFYRFLVARNRLTKDPVREIQLPKAEKKLPLVLTQTQIGELLAAPLQVKKPKSAPVWMPQRDAAIMEVFYSSGLRLGRARVAQRERSRYLHRIGPCLGKGRKERVCPVGAPALQAVSRYRAAANVHSGPLFLNKGRAENFAALDLADPETLPAPHVDPDRAQSAQAAA